MLRLSDKGDVHYIKRNQGNMWDTEVGNLFIYNLTLQQITETR